MIPLHRVAPRLLLPGHLLRNFSSPPSRRPPSSSVSTPPSQRPPESSLSLDFASEAGSESTAQTTGAKSSKDSLSSIERRRRLFSRFALGLFVSGVIAEAVYLGRAWEEDELKEKRLRIENAPSNRWGRMKSRLGDISDYFNKPLWNELLPPLLPPTHQKPFTLILSIDDLLVTSTWDRQHGWRTAKRPGVDYFIAYLSQFYEVVVFTTQNNYTAIPILEKLDPYNYFMPYRLFREATRSVDGKIVKDLSYLNRDLSKVIMLDTHDEHVSTHPENAIVIPKWKGDPTDRGLVAMIPFLESIGIYKPQDVRPILKAYQGQNVPLEYAKREAEAKRKHIEEWQKTKGPASGGFSISNLFGGASTSSSSVPLTYLEQKRKEAQFHYQEEQKFFQAHKGEFERLLEEDRQAMAKEMPGTLWGAMDAFTNRDNASKGGK